MDFHAVNVVIFLQNGASSIKYLLALKYVDKFALVHSTV